MVVGDEEEITVISVDLPEKAVYETSTLYTDIVPHYVQFRKQGSKLVTTKTTTTKTKTKTTEHVCLEY
ncbi:hypothetical protein M0804_011549 [Polistes exclamans]|nr:hypothetical protein M0804_011549 [Polistes exclamans]